MAPSLLPSPFPFDLSPVNSLAYLPSLSDPTRSLGIVIREHFRHHRPVQWEREKELRAAPEYVERPLCPAPLLPFCSFIAILHAQSADLADYADYGKYTQTQTTTHTHTHTHLLILYRDTTLSWTYPCNPFGSYNTFLWQYYPVIICKIGSALVSLGTRKSSMCKTL